MSEGTPFRVAAIVSALVGALLALGTRDGIYNTLDIPQALPALGPQIGGVALITLAYLQWSASANPALRRPVATAGALFYVSSAAVIASWLIFKHKVDLGIGDGGWVVLIVSAVVFAALGALLARASRG
jgi:hypothetical protein